MTIDRVQLNPGMIYSLVREGDSEGDAGALLKAVWIDDKGSVVRGPQGLIEVGKAVMCGSHYTRTYYHQDYWVTTKIKSIDKIETKDGSTIKVYFTTVSGSKYTLEVRG